MSVFLGVDVGTSGCRVCAIDSSAQVLTYTKNRFEPPTVNDQKITQDPQHWWRVVDHTIEQTCRQLNPARITAICVNGTSSTVVLTDKDGHPLGPAMMYNDASSITQAAQIAPIAPRASAAHGPTASLAKYLALLTQCQQRDRARHILHQADWLCGRLCGVWGISDENNALKLGYDPVDRSWPGWINTLPIDPTHLPQVHTPGKPIAPLRKQLIEKWRLNSVPMVVAGTTDSTAAALATGAKTPGDAITSLGSTLVLKVLSDQPVFAPEYGVYSHRLDNYWLVGGASNSGGAVLLQYFNMSELESLTAQLDDQLRDHPHSTNLNYYPLLREGERFPMADPHWAPKLTPRPPEDHLFLLAILEGMTNIEKQGYERLRQLGANPVQRIFTTGGGAHNPVWAQLRARHLQRPLCTPHQTEAAFGSALLARSSFV